ncbi:MAG: ribonuclease HI [Nitrospinota bacterium]|nr:ribonuclease HI [Nitrospinota bacterium]
MTSSYPLVEIFCDGACRGNPGPGGWGAVLESGAHKKELKGYKPRTTNNEMELSAAIESLKSLKKPSRVILCSDSNYVIQGMTSWIHSWMKNNWRTASRKPVKNQQLWMDLAAAASPHQVDWVWVKGHAGHPQNERADSLANEALDEAGN